MGEGSSQKSKKQKMRQRLEALSYEVDNELADMLLEESERGCVLVSSGFIEEALEHFLRDKFSRVCTKDKDAEDILIGYNSPLGSFHNRIIACSALGYIDEGLRNALLEFKRIRNSFAHRSKDNIRPSLSADKATDLLEKLVVSSENANAVLEAGDRLNVASNKHFDQLFADMEPENNAKVVEKGVALATRVTFILFVLVVLGTLRPAHSKSRDLS